MLRKLLLAALLLLVLQVLFSLCKNRLWMGAVYGMLLWLAIVVVSFEILAVTRYLLTVWVQGITLGAIAVSWLEHWVARMD